MYTYLASVILLAVACQADDQLLQVHLIYRHGDRTPLTVYPTDPNLPYWSAWPPGELTTRGMQQHYIQGTRLKQRYIDQLAFMSSTYKRPEISLESSQSYRCLQSCEANMAGFYQSSQGTFPSDSSWPSKWTPVPIRSVNGIHQHTVEPFNCAKTNELMVGRGTNEKFLEYQALHAGMIEKISQNSGESLTDFTALSHFLDCVRIEREFYNLTQPAWLTQSLYKELKEYGFRTSLYIQGGADFGEAASTDLLRLTGGPFITKVLNEMITRQNTTTDMPKMFVYSAHDTSVDAVLRTLGILSNLAGKTNVDYAAMLALELWKTDKGTYNVKAMFSANENSSLQPVTYLIDACSGGSDCPFSLFYNRNRPYLANNIVELCDNIL